MKRVLGVSLVALLVWALVAMPVLAQRGGPPQRGGPLREQGPPAEVPPGAAPPVEPPIPAETPEPRLPEASPPAAPQEVAPVPSLPAPDPGPVDQGPPVWVPGRPIDPPGLAVAEQARERGGENGGPPADAGGPPAHAGGPPAHAGDPRPPDSNGETLGSLEEPAGPQRGASAAALERVREMLQERLNERIQAAQPVGLGPFVRRMGVDSPLAELFSSIPRPFSLGGMVQVAVGEESLTVIASDGSPIAQGLVEAGEPVDVVLTAYTRYLVCGAEEGWVMLDEAEEALDDGAMVRVIGVYAPAEDADGGEKPEGVFVALKVIIHCAETAT